MTAIRYGRHFSTLAVAAVIFWVLRDLRLPIAISNFNYLNFALMGTLHAASITVSLRDRKSIRRVYSFILVATILSALTPFLGLFGSFVWIPFEDILRTKNLGADAILVTGSAIGASGYWLLVQSFWLRASRRAGWLWAVAFCVTSTLLVTLILRTFGEIDADMIGSLQTFAWWLAFSGSLYWTESAESKSKVMPQAVIGLGVALPLILIACYFTAVWWSPMDAITTALPQSLRNTMSRELIAGAGFGAEDFPAARRAVKFDPPNEEALVRLCATGVRDGTALQAALEACGKVASMTNNSFHAGVVAEAFEEAHRPCDGLPVLKKTMGDEATNNVSPIFSVGRLEAECGEMEHAESHLRAVVRLRLEDLRTFNWEDRPPSADENQNTYEGSERLSLSEARRNLSALLTLRHKDTEAFQVCRSALGSELKRCTCRFLPREGVDCDVSAAE